MASKKIVWDQVGERLYETGVSKGVLYPMKNGAYSVGVPWNGLTAVNETPSGAEPTALYADDIKYLNIMSTEEYAATIEAYMYPNEFEECDGSKSIAPGVVIGQQNRTAFGLSYVTKIGNDTDGSDHGYKIHLVYGCLASPSEKGHSTVNESLEAMTLSWSISTTPVEVPIVVDGKKTFKPTSTVVIDSTKVKAEELTKLEDMLYGSESADPKLPLPEELATIFTSAVAG